jgi:hypothetical protein
VAVDVALAGGDALERLAFVFARYGVIASCGDLHGVRTGALCASPSRDRHRHLRYPA